MEYKGYRGNVSYSDDDEILFGTIHGINDLVTFEGESVSELKAAFEDAVDDYLDMCERFGKEPEKSYKGSFNVRVSPELHKQCALKALTNDITLNQLVVDSLVQYVHTGQIFDQVCKATEVLAECIRGSNKAIWSNEKTKGFKAVVQADELMGGRCVYK